MRYLTLFVEKIVKHPQIKEVPAETKRVNKEKLIEIMAITEKLKAKLMQLYQKEYEQYLKDQEIERKRAIEEAKRKVPSDFFFGFPNSLSISDSRNSKMQKISYLVEAASGRILRLTSQRPPLLTCRISTESFILMTFLQRIRKGQPDCCQAQDPLLTARRSLRFPSWRADCER